MSQMKIRNYYQSIKKLIDADEVFKNVTITGTVIQIKQQQTAGYNGMTYFTISDGTEKIDSLDCFIFGVDNNITTGDLVECVGHFDFYPNKPVKSIQFSVKNWKKVGDGAEDKYNEIINKLKADKIIDIPKKLIKQFNKNICIIGGSTNAGTIDALTKLNNNMIAGQIYVYDTLMKPSDIIESIKRANKRGNFDVIMIVRGGGAKEDLNSLNDYELAKCIKESKIPIISGVGHQIDHTIIDDVADKVCMTPTDASDSIITEHLTVRNYLSKISSSYNNLVCQIVDKIHNYKSQCDTVEYANGISLNKSISAYNNVVNSYFEKMDKWSCTITNLCENLTSEFKNKINTMTNHIVSLEGNFCDTINKCEKFLNQKFNVCVEMNNKKINYKKDLIGKKGVMKIYFVDGYITINVNDIIT